MVDKKRILKPLILGILLLTFMVFFTQFLGLFGTGFSSEEIQTQTFFYIPYGIGFLVGIFLIFMVELIITKGDNKYGNSLGFASQGEFPALSYFKKFSMFRLILLSLIVFSVLAYLIFIFGNQETFTGLQVLPQQFNPQSSIAFSSALIPASENLGAGFFIALMFIIIRTIARRFNWSKGNFAVLVYILVPLIIGAYGVGNHIFRGYQGIALWVVFFFWTIGGVITIFTGSFIPFWIMHFDNNFFFDFKRLFDIDIARYYIAGVIIILIILYLFLYVFRKKKSINKI